MNLRFALACAVLGAAACPLLAQIDTVQEITPGVYFHQGDPRRGHSNNGWIVFEDYVLLIDANYPSGAKIIMPKIRETTIKPVCFVFDTHHHGDHAYGNQVWVDQGAVPVAYVGVLDEMKKFETGYYGGAPGRWENSAKTRPDVAESRLKPPSVLFPKELFLDDGKRRVELRHYGVAHTNGDAMAWLPKEKILFTGDACVNSASNNVNDGNIAEWIKTLEALKQLGAEKVCVGHGPIGGPEVLVDQQRYFIELQKAVKARRDAKKTDADVKAELAAIGEELKKIPNIARFVPANMAAHVQKAWREIGGGALPP